MKLQRIKAEILQLALQSGRDGHSVQLLIASKNQAVGKIEEILIQGQRIFGENRVQEAHKKWPRLRKKFSDVELHLIGHLQSNKVKEAVQLFDVIQTLDSIKLADKLSHEEVKQNKKLRYLIEINLGGEIQKTGVSVAAADEFIQLIKNNYPLHLIGVMCIPPHDQNPTTYFKELTKIAKKHQLPQISMGMSADFREAILCGATMVRIGEAIFGPSL